MMIVERYYRCSLKNWKQAENKRFSRESLSRQNSKVKERTEKETLKTNLFCKKILIEQKQSSV